MVKKPRPSAKADSKASAKADSRPSVKNETAATEKAEAVAVKEETLVPEEKGGIIDFYLFFCGLGILIGVFFIIVGLLRYVFHII